MMAKPVGRLRTSLAALPLGGRTVVTWREGGHTCILSTTGTSAAVLERLASWRQV